MELKPMRKRRIGNIGLWVIVGLIMGPSRLGWSHSEEAAICTRVYSEMVVDGTLVDWVRRLESSNWTGRLEAQKGNVMEWMRATPTYLNALTSKTESGVIKSAEDFSAKVYFLWDSEYLHISSIVYDDEVVTQHEGEDIWQDDALELWIDCRHDAVTHTLFQDDEFQLGFSPASQHRNHAVAWAWRNPQAKTVTAAMKMDSSLIQGGYIIEASVPWKVLKGCQPKDGSLIGFNISMVDKDEDGLWTHITWSGSLHSDPSQFGHLYFVDAPIDLFPSDVFSVPSDASALETLWGPTGESRPPKNRE